MIIIPDVHGRIFWKDAVKENEKVVFLGDYVDPYPGEGISLEGAIENFEEIIEYKKSNPDNTILLLGNHDFMYLDSKHNKISCSHDYMNEPKITKLLMTPGIFQMSYTIEISGVAYIFSHAGILQDWVDKHTGVFGEHTSLVDVAKLSNELYQKRDQKFIDSLLDFSFFRGGDELCGSMIWSDVREHATVEDHEEKVYQIFGHTQRQSDPVRNGDDYDLDCRRCFYLTDECVVLDSLTDEEVKDNGEDEMNAYKETLFF